jgi:hypothetical protein
MLPQPAFLRGIEGAIGVGKAVFEGAFPGRFGARFDVANRPSEAFWGAIGYKVNDIPCSHFCAAAGANQASPSNVLQPGQGYPQGSACGKKL